MAGSHRRPQQVSSRGLVPRLSIGTLQLSIRCSSIHFLPKRSFPVSTLEITLVSGPLAACDCSCAMAGDSAGSGPAASIGWNASRPGVSERLLGGEGARKSKIRNPAGRLRGSRNKLSEAVICALLRDFSRHGEKAIAKVRRDQPGIYLKVLALLIPRQDKLEHTNTIKTMTDEELESAIAFLREMMAAQAVGSAHLVEMKAEPAALPAPGGHSTEKLSSKRKLNRLMTEVDTAIGPQERIPRRMRPPAGE